MKKFILLLAVLFLLPAACFAEVYQNHDHNFQMEIPDGWVNNNKETSKEYILSKIDKYQRNGNAYVAGLRLSVDHDNDVLGIDSYYELPETERRNVLNSLVEGFKVNNPSFEPTYSDFNLIGNCWVGLVKGNIDKSPYKITMAITKFNRNRYVFYFLTNDPERAREPEFMEMIKSLKPIY